MECVVCGKAKASPYRPVDGIGFHKCDGCGSIFADPEFLARVDAGLVSNYQEDYWANEMKAATERLACSMFMKRRPSTSSVLSVFMKLSALALS